MPFSTVADAFNELLKRIELNPARSDYSTRSGNSLASFCETGFFCEIACGTHVRDVTAELSVVNLEQRREVMETRKSMPVTHRTRGKGNAMAYPDGHFTRITEEGTRVMNVAFPEGTTVVELPEADIEWGDGSSPA
jgi:hypothetical protein